ncbi:MAG: 6-phosphofructokinase [Verrucomicrobia bacterium]|nr:6-phosphofructokinase [Verrucomicrobiota bacterium]|tara:strand:+ start:244 stop:1215 length:972 start_codon:yes stop_codon:yes gene_type:complete
MNKLIKHIGVFTSGGDSPGMNAALFGIVKAASINGIKISGIRRGFEGMIDGDFVEIHLGTIQEKVSQGGTILKTARSKRFRTIEGRKKALKNLKDRGLDALIAIGGDGTFQGLLAFAEISDIPCLGIPGTIDNDLSGADYTLGFDTAVNTAIENIDKIKDTAESHNRIFIVEVMGRDSGYIAIHSGIGAAVDAILIPECQADFSALIQKISQYEGEDAFTVIVSEGDEIGSGQVASEIKSINPSVDLRITILGHLQRGGSPSAFDRMLGIRSGVAAIDELLKGEKNKMVGYFNNQLLLTPFDQVVKQHVINQELEKLLNMINN